MYPRGLRARGAAGVFARAKNTSGRHPDESPFSYTPAVDPALNKLGTTGGSRLRTGLLFLKNIGVVAALGGLAALAAIGRFGPVPEDPEGWVLLRGVMRAVFLPCVLGGLLLTVGAGIGLFLRSPRRLLRARWFRVKVVALAIALPSLHLWARGRVIAFYAAIEVGELEGLEARLAGVTQAYLVALAFLLTAAVFARVKPALGGR